MERLANSATTTLNGSITNVATTLTVTAATLFPTAGNFTILIDSEIMLVTAVAGAVFTVTRAQEGSTGAAHSSAAAVKLVATRDAMKRFVEDRFVAGALTNYNAVTNQAKLYQGTDAPYAVLNGAYILPSPVMPLNVWDPATFTWFNQGTATYTKLSDFCTRFDVPHTGGDNLRGIQVAYTAPKTLEAWIDPFGTVDAWMLGGIVFKNSSDNQMLACQIMNRNLSTGVDASKISIVILYMTSFTATGSLEVQRLVVPRFPILIRGVDNSPTTTITWSFSFDGVTFTTLFTQVYTARFTPNRVGVVFNNNSGLPASWYVNSFRVY